jgi:serine/threonine protein kinase
VCSSDLRTVALKFLKSEILGTESDRARFIQEAQVAARLEHPNICTVYEIDERDGQAFIAMAYCAGRSLKDRIKESPLSVPEALGIAVQTAEGLEEAHAKGVIHRDIKSANIIVSARGQVKIMDFGIAKLAAKTQTTWSGTVAGTVAYMSPEQARGQDLDPRTDIWSLGVVLYEMLAGKLPFRGDHDQAVIHQIVHAEPDPLKKARPDVPPGVEEIVGQALAKKPASRYRTMEEFREDLSAVAEGLRPLKAKARPSEPERSIAVLPFINDSPDQENTYFINGVMEEILGSLQKIKALRVISRTRSEERRVGQECTG